MSNIEFHSVRNAECDFCGKTRNILTQANETYICRKCSTEIGRHCRENERMFKREKLLSQEGSEKDE